LWQSETAEELPESVDSATSEEKKKQQLVDSMNGILESMNIAKKEIAKVKVSDSENAM
jgi:hypothetical protein